MRYWTKQEDELLMIVWPMLGKSAAWMFERRTGHSLAKRAAKIIKSAVRWTEAEDEIIKRHYPLIGDSCDQYLAGRSRVAIRKHAAALGIRVIKKATVCDAKVKRETSKPLFYPKPKIPRVSSIFHLGAAL